MGYKLVLRIILLMLDYSVDIPGITVCRAFHVLLMSAIASSAISEVVVCYRDYNFQGVNPMGHEV